MKKSAKIIIMILIIVFVLSFASIAFAYNGTFTNVKVYGGASQQLAYGTRIYSYAVFNLQRAYPSGNPGTWRMRAYVGTSNTENSELYDINRGGDFNILYFDNTVSMSRMMQSVTSSNTSDYYWFDGSLRM